MDDLMKRVIEDYFGEPMPENVNLSCPTTLHDCIEIAKHYAAQQSVQADGCKDGQPHLVLSGVNKCMVCGKRVNRRR